MKAVLPAPDEFRAPAEIRLPGGVHLAQIQRTREPQVLMRNAFNVRPLSNDGEFDTFQITLGVFDGRVNPTRETTGDLYACEFFGVSREGAKILLRELKRALKEKPQ